MNFNTLAEFWKILVLSSNVNQVAPAVRAMNLEEDHEFNRTTTAPMEPASLATQHHKTTFGVSTPAVEAPGGASDPF